MPSTSDNIQEGDYVKVNFHNAQFTLCKRAKVIHKPSATGDSWVFKDFDNDKVHAVSEGCTITKLDLSDMKAPPTGKGARIPLHKLVPTIAECKKKSILPTLGTAVCIADTIKPRHELGGIFVHERHFEARKAGASGEYHGYVAGHGGDVWWVKHRDGTVGAYLTDEVFDA